MLATQSPFVQYFDTDGSPLDGGSVYFGVANQNPETSPVAVYWDAAGTQPAAQPIRTVNGYTVRSGSPAIVYTNDDYSLLVRDARGRQVLYAPNSADFGNAATVAGLVAALRADLASTSDTAKGDDLIGVKLMATGSATRTQHDKNAEFVSLTDFGADPTGIADSAAAIDAWLTYCYTNNVDGYAPPGTYLTSTGHTVTYSASKKFQIRGAGRGATSFRKTGANTGAVFKFTISSGGYLELNLHLQDFEVDAPDLSAVNGIEFDAAGFVTMSRVRATACFVGLEAKGLLVSAIRDCDFTGNEVGMRFRRATAGSQPYCNAVLIENCRANANSSWGLDFGQGSGLNVRSCDIESGGTAGDTTTGGVIIRGTIDDEAGVGYVSFDGLWLEGNKGHSFYTEDAANAYIDLKNIKVSAPESGRAIRVGAVRDAYFENVLCLGAASELVCGAENIHLAGNNSVGIWTPGAGSKVSGRIKTALVDGHIWESSEARVVDMEVSTSFLGTVDGAVNLGSGSRRFNTVYATTGAINTSDEREKTAIRSLAAAERAVALAIKSELGAFKFLTAVADKGEAARWHFGVGAQTVAAAFKAEGLDPHDYGLFCYDEWPESESQPAGHRYGIRYDELAMFILAAT